VSIACKVFKHFFGLIFISCKVAKEKFISRKKE
jgi:hypothetical protein